MQRSIDLFSNIKWKYVYEAKQRFFSITRAHLSETDSEEQLIRDSNLNTAPEDQCQLPLLYLRLFHFPQMCRMQSGLFIIIVIVFYSYDWHSLVNYN